MEQVTKAFCVGVSELYSLRSTHIHNNIFTKYHVATLPLNLLDSELDIVCCTSNTTNNAALAVSISMVCEI